MFDATEFSPFDAFAVAYLLYPDQFMCHAVIVRRRGLFVVRETRTSVSPTHGLIPPALRGYNSLAPPFEG
ncbi:MAG: hypothetical protein JSR29_18005 [Nitrospira sp.]|nr:hypothetical protein [Nitrospira sp.]